MRLGLAASMALGAVLAAFIWFARSDASGLPDAVGRNAIVMIVAWEVWAVLRLRCGRSRR